MGGAHFCDYPGCLIVSTQAIPKQSASNQAKSKKQATPAGKASGSGSLMTPGSRLPAGFTTRPTLLTQGKGTAARDPSPAGSDDSSSSQKASRSKIFCFDCYDPSGSRCMNFHADCWNRWHGLCGECNDA